MTVALVAAVAESCQCGGNPCQCKCGPSLPGSSFAKPKPQPGTTCNCGDCCSCKSTGPGSSGPGSAGPTEEAEEDE